MNMEEDEEGRMERAIGHEQSMNYDGKCNGRHERMNNDDSIYVWKRAEAWTTKLLKKMNMAMEDTQNENNDKISGVGEYGIWRLKCFMYIWKKDETCRAAVIWRRLFANNIWRQWKITNNGRTYSNEAMEGEEDNWRNKHLSENEA